MEILSLLHPPSSFMQMILRIKVESSEISFAHQKAFCASMQATQKLRLFVVTEYAFLWLACRYSSCFQDISAMCKLKTENNGSDVPWGCSLETSAYMLAASYPMCQTEAFRRFPAPRVYPGPTMDIQVHQDSSSSISSVMEKLICHESQIWPLLWKVIASTLRLLCRICLYCWIPSYPV